MNSVGREYIYIDIYVYILYYCWSKSVQWQIRPFITDNWKENDITKQSGVFMKRLCSVYWMVILVFQKFLAWMIVIITNLCNKHSSNTEYQDVYLALLLEQWKSLFIFFLIWYYYPSAELLKSFQLCFVIWEVCGNQHGLHKTKLIEF